MLVCYACVYYVRYVLRYDAYVNDVMIGRSELRRRLGNTGTDVRKTATRQCYKIY